MAADGSLGGLGLAGLVLVSLVGGFVLATSFQPQDHLEVASFSSTPGALLVEITEPVRLHLVAQPNGSDAAPRATVSLFDPRDRFVERLVVRPSGESTPVHLDRAGSWVLFLSGGERLRVSVEVARTANASLPAPPAELPVTRAEHTVAQQEEGRALEAQLSVRVGQTPADAELAYTGRVEGLHAVVESERGPVYEVRLDHGDTNDNRSRPAGSDADARPTNLAPGTYTVVARADALEGRLTFRYHTYERPTNETTDATGNLATLLSQGPQVAQLQQDRPVALDPQGAESLLLVAEPHTNARVLVYDGTDSVVAVLRLGEERSGWDWDQARGNRTARAVSYAIDPGQTYALVATDLYGGQERLHVVLPGLDHARPARELETVEQTVRLGGVGSQAREERRATLDGGLLAVRSDATSIASGGQRLEVVGPHGRVHVHEVQAGVLGAGLDQRIRTHAENFTTGELVLAWEAETAGASMEVLLVSYHR